MRRGSGPEQHQQQQDQQRWCHVPRIGDNAETDTAAAKMASETSLTPVPLSRDARLAGITEEMMGDAMDDAMDDEETEEEQDALVQQASERPAP